MTYIKTIQIKCNSAGFTLIELLVGLTIGTILLSLVIRVYDANHRLFLTNKALMDVFFDAQFIIPLLNSEIQQAGNTNIYFLNTPLSEQQGKVKEAEFIVAHPIVSALTYPQFPLIQSTEGDFNSSNDNNGSDQIIINTMAEKSCTGTNFAYNEGTLFHVVNHYYLDGTTLRCKSYDGQYLRGIISEAPLTYSVALLEYVYDMQIQYGINLDQELDSTTSDNITVQTSSPDLQFIWVNANKLPELITENVKVLAVNIVLLLGVKTNTKLLMQTQLGSRFNKTFILPDGTLIKQFETTIILKS